MKQLDLLICFQKHHTKYILPSVQQINKIRTFWGQNKEQIKAHKLARKIESLPNSLEFTWTCTSLTKKENTGELFLAYDRLPREVLWKELEKEVQVAYIQDTKDTYGCSETSVQTHGGTTMHFHITIVHRLHQGSIMKPYLFTLVLGAHTQHIQEPMLQCMLCSDDIVLVGESKTV